MASASILVIEGADDDEVRRILAARQDYLMRHATGGDARVGSGGGDTHHRADARAGGDDPGVVVRR